MPVMFYCVYCEIVFASFFSFILPICNKNQMTILNKTIILVMKRRGNFEI